MDAGPLAILQTTIIILAGFQLLREARNGQFQFSPTPLDLPIFLFLLFAGISVLISVYPYASRIAIYKLLTYFAFFYLAIKIFKKPEKRNILVWVVVIFGSLYAISALVFAGSNTAGLTNFNIFSRYEHRLTLTFENYNHFAGYLEMILFLTLGLALANQGRWRLLLLISSSLIAFAIVLSQSRGGMLSVLVSAVFFSLYFSFCKVQSKKLRLATILSFLVIVSITAWGSIHRFERVKALKNPLEATNVSARWDYWSATMDLISDYPLFGTGLGSYVYVFPRYQVEGLTNRVALHPRQGLPQVQKHLNTFGKYAHNDYVELTAEMGISGLFAAILGILVFFIYCLRNLYRLPDPKMQSIGLGALTACFCLLLHSFTDFNLKVPSNALLFTTCAAIAIITAASGNTSVKNITLSNKGKIASYLVISLLCAVAFGAIIAPYLGKCFSGKAEKYQKSKQHDLALAALENAIYIDRGNAELLSQAGDLMLQRASSTRNSNEQKQWLASALKYYEQAIESCPVRGYYHSQKAQALLQMNNFNKAETALKEASYWAPQSAFSWYDLGKFYLNQERFSESHQAYRRFFILFYLDWGSGERAIDMMKAVLDEILESGKAYKDLALFVPENSVIVRMFNKYLSKRGQNRITGEQTIQTQ